VWSRSTPSRLLLGSGTRQCLDTSSVNCSVIAGLCLLLAAELAGQSRVVSPTVHPDRRVTFRLRAPNAKEVSVRGSWTVKFDSRFPAAREAGGDWFVTVGPLPPDRYTYHFLLDGTAVADPENPAVKLGIRGPASIVDVPGAEAEFHALRPVPHGVIHVHRYWSEVAASIRQLHVYTPPGYQNGKQRYPVLYLLHGSGDTDAAWFEQGKAAEILDNLIAEDRARPMLIVAPDSFMIKAADPASRLRNTELFSKELSRAVIPLVEASYRVHAGRDMRALAGLSMGGGQTLNIGLPRLDMFAYLGVFSSGPLSQGDTVPQFLARHASVLRDPSSMDRKLKQFWIACGTDDESGVPNTQALLEILKERGIRHESVWTPGGHTWSVWRDYLHRFLPKLFR